MFRWITIGLACLGLLTLYSYFNPSAKEELAQTEQHVHAAQARVVAEVKSLDDSALSKEIASWVEQVPAPSAQDLLQWRSLVDRLRADPQAARQTWAQWRAEWAALCKEQLSAHLPDGLHCSTAK